MATVKPASWAKDSRAWRGTLEVLKRSGSLDENGLPLDYAIAYNIYTRILAKRPRARRPEGPGARVTLAGVPEPAAWPGPLKRHELLAMDIGGWWAGYGHAWASNDETTQCMTLSSEFRKYQPTIERDVYVIQPLVCWAVERSFTSKAAAIEALGGERSLGPGTVQTGNLVDSLIVTRLALAYANWLTRDSRDAQEWMARELQGALDLIDEAILDVEHSMPTVGGVEVRHTELDHRATKDLLRESRLTIEAALAEIDRS